MPNNKQKFSVNHASKAKFKNGILNIEIPKVTPKVEEAVKIDID